MSNRLSFEYITETATAPARNWTLRATLQFHYFNPNGLVARKRRNDDRIAELVDAGTVPGDWHLAYGTMNSYFADRVAELAMQRRTTRAKAHSALELLREDCEKQEAKIAEASASAAA